MIEHSTEGKASALFSAKWIVSVSWKRMLSKVTERRNEAKRDNGSERKVMKRRNW